MSLNQEQQFNELINSSKRILICVSEKFSRDAVASSVALSKILKKQNKLVEIVISDFELPNELSFLAETSEIKNKLTNLQNFVINLNLSEKKVNEFSYDVQNDKLKIFVLPEQGNFEEKDISVENSAYRFDLIITLDASDLESLGKIYFDNSEFFFDVPIINIDSKLNNENYGQLNLIKTTAVSTSEVLYEVLEKEEIDENIATDLLAGMIDKTNSFKTNDVSPKNLRTVSELINLGAERDKIVKSFYQTKSLASLKLWGRVLARLQYDAELKLVWSSMPYSDFIKSNAKEKDLNGVIEEMIVNSPQAEIILLLNEREDDVIFGQLYTTPNYDSKFLLNNYEVKGSKNFVEFEISASTDAGQGGKDKSLKEIENEVIGEIRGKLGG